MAGKTELYEGIKLFNDGFYFEAHDFFESLWLEEVSKNKNLFQAFTHLSVGAYHLSSFNNQGALSQLKKALQKFNEYPELLYNINLLKLRQDINYLIRQITVFYSKKNYKFDITNISFFEQNA